MQITAETRVATLIEALPFIQKFRGHTFVIKYGGAAMEDPHQVERLLGDIVFLEAVGINPVVLHGGGKAITAKMRDAGLTAKFVNGLRITDAASVKIVEETLDTVVNPRIVQLINEFDGNAQGLSGKLVFKAVRLGAQTENGETIDPGFVGEVVSVETTEVQGMISRDIVPVISSIASNGDGVLNVNADTAAAALAIALKATKLIYVSDVPGIMRDPQNKESLIPSITIEQTETLIEEETINGGMIPKVRSATNALKEGVGKIHFLSGGIAHALLLEIFTSSGIGTEIIL